MKERKNEKNMLICYSLSLSLSLLPSTLPKSLPTLPTPSLSFPLPLSPLPPSLPPSLPAPSPPLPVHVHVQPKACGQFPVNCEVLPAGSPDVVIVKQFFLSRNNVLRCASRKPNCSFASEAVACRTFCKFDGILR